MMTLSRDLGLSTAEKTDKLSEAYARYFDPVARQADAAVGDVQALFDASNMLASYTMYFRLEENSKYVGAMVRAHDVLRSRGLSSSRNAQELYGALVAARRFDEARDLARAGHGLLQRVLPAFEVDEGFDPARPGYFDLAVSRGGFVLRNDHTRDGGTRIIVVSGCHAARDAARGIANDPRLREAFRRADALWLAPADRTFDLAEVRQWHSDFPESPIRIAFNHAAWNDIDFTRQPTFFFFKHGRLVAKSAGWTRSGPPHALLTALRDTGLLHTPP